MRSYIVTAGYVTVETAVSGGRALVDVAQGKILPDDVPQEQVDHELRLGTIEPVEAEPPHAPPSGQAAPEQTPDPNALPPGMSVSATLTWVGGNEERALAALLAEQASASPRATLLDRLTKVIDAGAKQPE